MSARTRRRKPSTGAQPHVQPSGQPAAAAHTPVPLPKWQWRTFPVYFAFALGGFIGLYMAIIAQAASDEGSNIGWILAFGFWAILLGFGISRITTRWLISHNWAPASRRPRKK